MSKVSLTKEQLDAINIRNKNIIVSAQAGAGKTHILVERIINLLEEEKIDINDFLIVTFTNKAAGEMKSRIKKSLLEKMENADEENKKYYQKQFNNTTNAQISTMHAFCINVLRDYFYKLGINPGFKILSNSTINILKYTTMSQIFQEKYFNKDEKFFSLLEQYTTKYTDENLISILFSIYDFLQSQIYPFEWFKEKIDKYSYSFQFNEEKIKEFKVNIFDLYYDLLMKLVNKSLGILKDITNIYGLDSILYREVLDSDYELLNSLKNSSSIDELLSLKELSFRTKSAPKKKVKEEYEESDIEFVKQKIDEYRNPVKAFLNELEIDIDKEIELESQMKTNLESIYSILLEFDKRFKSAKDSNNGLEFSDIEHLTIKLLEDQEVIQSLSAKFKYIFFDEYQDSNQTQNYIVNKIKRKDNIFFVGDIKQSIYKFRLADPLIFKDRYNNYKSDEDSISIDLKHNFRSERVLLNFNNFVFNSLMTTELGDVDYDESHRFTHGKSEYSDDKSMVSLNFIDLSNEEIIQGDGIDREILSYNPEALFTALKVKSLITKGAKFKDIAVLARASSILKEVTFFLEKMGIPFYSESIKFDFDDVELKVFIEILKAIDNDTDDITLLSAISSTLGNFSDEEMAIVRGDDKKHSYNYCFRNFTKEQDPVVYQKIKDYQEKIFHFKRLSKIMSVYDFAWIVLVESGHMSYILSKENRETNLENIKIFIEEIKELESSGFQTLTSFIAYIDKLFERKLSERESGAELSEEDNVVRLMTIHKSKGLQFEHVILLNMNKKFNKVDLSKEFVLNDNLGIAMVVNSNDGEYQNPFSYKMISKEKQRELLSEEVRILYVALSRAIKTMHLVSSSKKFNIENSDFSSMSSYQDWIYSIYFKDQISKSANIENNIKKSTDYFKDKEINLHFNKINLPYLYKNLSSELKSRNYKEEINFSNTSKLEGILRIDEKYDYSLVNTPFKKTVTELSRQEDNRSEDFTKFDEISPDIFEKTLIQKRPRFITDSDLTQLSSLEKGSLYHYIFERLPLNLEEKDIENYLDNLVKNDEISKFERDNIEVKLLINYVNSNLYKRIGKSPLVLKEKSFTMMIEEEGSQIMVDGQIDLFFEEDDELVILDFKTNKKVDEKLYSKQVELYRIGLEKAYGKKVKEKLIYWVMHGQTSIIN